MGAIFSPSTGLAIACIIGLGVMLGAWLPPSFGLALGLAPPHMRASIMSVIQLSATFFALALGPVLVGLLSDRIGGARSLLYAMGLVFSVMFIAAISYFAAGLKARGQTVDVTATGALVH
jgi:MFS family permease